MGNQTTILTHLDADVLKQHAVIFPDYCIASPGSILPVQSNGHVVTFAKIRSYTKRANGGTVLTFEETTQPSTNIELEFNWIIKLKDEESLETRLRERTFTFEKAKDPHYRDYPVGIPIEIWRYARPSEPYAAVALGKATIDVLNVGNNCTKGICTMLKVFDANERDIISKNFI